MPSIASSNPTVTAGCTLVSPRQENHEFISTPSSSYAVTDSESACDKLALTHPSLKLAGSEAPDQAVTVSMAEWHGTRLLSDSESDPVQVRFPDRARLRAKGTWGPWPATPAVTGKFPNRKC